MRGRDLDMNLTSSDVDNYSERDLGNAYVFLSDMRNNPELSDRWIAVKKKLELNEESADQKREIINKFLTDSGYDTTPEAVLHISKQDWWDKYVKENKPTKASDAFAQELLGNKPLMDKWENMMKKAADTSDFEEANRALAALGYECTPQQVQASFNKMRMKNPGFFAGIYGQTEKKLYAVQNEDSIFAGADEAKDSLPVTADISHDTAKDDKNHKNANQSIEHDNNPGLNEASLKKKSMPVVVLFPDKRLRIDGIEIFGTKYDNGTISWPFKPDKTKYLPNNSSGALTFGTVTKATNEDGYVGNYFSGVIVESNRNGKQYVYSMYGRVGYTKTQEKSIAMRHMKPKERSRFDLLMTYAQYILTVGFLVQLVVGAVLGAKSIYLWATGKNEDDIGGKSKLDKQKKALEKKSEELRSKVDETDYSFNKASLSEDNLELVEGLEKDLEQEVEITKRAELREEINEVIKSESVINEGDAMAEELAEETRIEEVVEELPNIIKEL